MDWELMSQQIVRHVEDCLPQDHPPPVVHELKPSAAQEPTCRDIPPLASRTTLWREQSREERNPTSVPTHGNVSPVQELVDTWIPPARWPTAQAVPGSHVLESSVSQRLERLDALTDDLRQTQAALNNAVKAQKEDATGRTLVEVSLTKMDEIMRRVSLVERRVMEQDNDFADSRIMSARAEGRISALQGRQVQLEANVCETRDTLAALDRRCASAESTLHGAVSHGQTIDTIRSVIGPFREEVETRLSTVEKDSLGQASTKIRDLSAEIAIGVEKALAAEMQRAQTEIEQLRTWVEATMAEERKQKERVLAELNGQADHLSRDIKIAQHECLGAETRVKELELTVESMGRRLATGGADEISRIRREIQNNEVALQRRIEEVQASDIRRMDEISRDILREKENRMSGLKEVSEEVTSFRASFLQIQSEQRSYGQIHDRLDRVERRVVKADDDNAQTKNSVFSISTQLKQIRLQIQDILNARDVSIHLDTLPGEGCQEPRSHPVTGDQMPPLFQPVLTTALPQTPMSASNRPSPNTSVGSCSEPSPQSANLAKAGAASTCTSTHGGDLEACATAGAAAGLARDVTPTPLKASGSDNTQRVPGQIPLPHSTETKAPAPAYRGCGDRQKDIEVQSATIEKRLGDSCPSEREIGSSEGGGNGTKTLNSKVAPAARHGSIPVANMSQTTSPSPFPANIEEGDGEKVQQPSKMVSMEHLRKAALATVSLSAEEDAGVIVARDQATENRRRRSAFAESETSSSASSSCSPTQSPCPSSPLLSSPSRFLAGKGVENPEVNAAPAPRNGNGHTPNPTPSEAKPSPKPASSILEPTSGGLPPDTGESVAGAEELRGRGVLSTATAVAPNKGSETVDAHVEQDSDSSSSMEDDDGETGETTPGDGLFESATTSKSPPCEGRASTSNNAAWKRPQREESSPPAPPPPRTTTWETRRKSLEGSITGPSPVSFRERSGSKDSGLVTAQCEFCLRRYLKAAMNTHLQGCELRLVRCPFQCGVKVLVRNLEKHKNSCSMRPSLAGEQNEDVEAAATCVAPSAPNPTTTIGVHSTSPSKEQEQEQDTVDHAASDSRNLQEEERVLPGGRGPGQGDPSRMVTCMRCQESMPFLLVPSHGARCKGKKESGQRLGATPAAPPVAYASEKHGLPLRLPINSPERGAKTGTVAGVAADKPTPGEVPSQSVPSPHISPRDLGISTPFSSRLVKGAPPSPPAVGTTTTTTTTKAWHHEASRIGDGVPPEGLKVPLSPGRSKNVRTWGTRQVTSWLRDIMRPPRADVISRFHDSGVDGVTLLGVTNRYLLHPTEGMGITDEATRRQILKALDALKE